MPGESLLSIEQRTNNSLDELLVAHALPYLLFFYVVDNPW